VLQVKLRAGEFAPAMQLSEPLITLGVVQPLHVKIDIDEADIPRADLRSTASVSPRGASGVRVAASFVRVEPLVVPKRSLTNAANERVDTRVLQVVYALPDNAQGFFVGQQVDAFIAALPTLEGARSVKP
jgi:HlyD family secretion protein